MTEKKDLLRWLSDYEKVPHKPGVYWFVGEKGEVLYVGKAKDLKNRLGSYAQLTQVQGKTRKMVLEAQRLKFQELENELTALLVEAELVRLHQPAYNILLKDDKSPLYIYITEDEFPVVKTIRKKDVQRLQVQEGVKSRNIFGPYQSSYRTKEILKLVRPIFKWCEKPVQDVENKMLEVGANENNLHPTTYNLPLNLKACFYYHIQRCSGACLGLVSKQEYQDSITRLKKFLRGKTKEVQRDLEKEMKQAVQLEEFEKAAEYRDSLQLIERFLAPTFHLKPDLQLPKLHQSQIQEGLVYLRKEIRQFFPLSKDYLLERIEGYDVSNIQGKNASVSMVTFTKGQPDKANYRLFNIRTLNTPNDYHMMKEAVTRRQKHPEWGLPSLVVIDGGRGQLRAALSVWKWEIPVVSLVKNPDRLVIPVFDNPNDRNIENLKYHFVMFDVDHPTLKLLQQIRDESHRFAKKQHSKLRDKALVQ